MARIGGDGLNYKRNYKVTYRSKLGGGLNDALKDHRKINETERLNGNDDVKTTPMSVWVMKVSDA